MHAVNGICERHGWDVGSPEAVNHLANTGQLHFEEADLDVMVQLENEQEQKFNVKLDLLLTGEGEPGFADFDQALATMEYNLANALTGIAGD